MPTLNSLRCVMLDQNRSRTLTVRTRFRSDRQPFQLHFCLVVSNWRSPPVGVGGRRGTSEDRIFLSMENQRSRSPNKAASGKGAIALIFFIVSLGRAVPEQFRSTTL